MMIASIIVNVIVLALVSDNTSAFGKLTVTHVNLALLFVFFGDLLLRFIAEGFEFFAAPWNLFDLVVFSASVLGQIYLYGLFYTVSENGGMSDCSSFLSVPYHGR
jgi:hypothetical protein